MADDLYRFTDSGYTSEVWDQNSTAANDRKPQTHINVIFNEKAKERGNINRKALDFNNFLDFILECLNFVIYSEKTLG